MAVSRGHKRPTGPKVPATPTAQALAFSCPGPWTSFSSKTHLEMIFSRFRLFPETLLRVYHCRLLLFVVMLGAGAFRPLGPPSNPVTGTYSR